MPTSMVSTVLEIEREAEAILIKAGEEAGRVTINFWWCWAAMGCGTSENRSNRLAERLA